MRGCTAVLLAALLASVQLANGQTVLDALTGLWRGNQGSVQRGAVNLARLSARPPQSNFTLPQCRTTNVLLNTGGFPKDWAKLQPQDQVSRRVLESRTSACTVAVVTYWQSDITHALHTAHKSTCPLQCRQCDLL
jgi:hypothetical protein